MLSGAPIKASRRVPPLGTFRDGSHKLPLGLEFAGEQARPGTAAQHIQLRLVPGDAVVRGGEKMKCGRLPLCPFEHRSHIGGP